MKASSLKALFLFLAVAVWAEASAATISGKITYSGSAKGRIYVVAYTDTLMTGASAGMATLTSPGNYSITGLSDGSYYLVSLLMTDSTGNIKPTDPWGAYESLGKLAPATIAGGGSLSGIDIVLVDGTVENPNPFYKTYAAPKQTTLLPDVTKDGRSEVLVTDGSVIYMHKHDSSGAASGKMYKINPYTGEVIATYSTSLTSVPNGTSWLDQMVFHNGVLWAGGGYGDPLGAGGKAGIFRFDMGTCVSSNQKPENAGIVADEGLGGLASDGVNLYVGVTLATVPPTFGIVKFDPSAVSEVPISPLYPLSNRPGYLTYGNGFLWAGYDDGVKKIDPANGTIRANYNFPRQSAGLFLDNMLWRYDASDNSLKGFDVTTVGVEKEKDVAVPSGFALAQNYPNPFNPVTVIRYQLPRNGFALIAVYDALGREVATVVNEQQEAGTYSVCFDASQLSSGLYYYTLRAGEYAATRLMVVMK